MTELKRGRIVLNNTRPVTRGMGCVCSGPAYGTPYCACELAWMQEQTDGAEYDDEDYEDRKK